MCNFNECHTGSIIPDDSSNFKQKNIIVKPYIIGGEILGENEKIVFELLPGHIQTVNFRGIIRSAAWEKDLKNMVAAQVKSDKRNATFFKYVTAK